MRTQRKQPRQQLCIKPAEPNKSNSAKTLKVSVKPFQRLAGSRDSVPVAPAGAKHPQHILMNKAKVTVKPSKTIKSKSAMQLKNIGTTDVTKVTI